MLDILLSFLGINCWYTNFFFVKKKKLEFKFDKQLIALKSTRVLNLINSPSPEQTNFTIEINENVSIIKKLFYTLYTFYSLLIFLLLCIQPFYTLVMYILNKENIKYLSSTLLHFNIPLIYIWAKIYFSKNHFEIICKCSNYKTSLILVSSIISIVINYLDISSFYNEYYWTYVIDNSIAFYIIITIEWIYTRLLMFLFVYTFMFIMYSHVKRLGKFKNDLEKNEFDFEENTCLSNIISEIAKIRHEIEFTIMYFNNIISITTLLGGISFAIFIRDVFSKDFLQINFEDHDRYLLHAMIFYLLSNIFLVVVMTVYSYKRDAVLKYTKSMNFMNRFLCRISSEKIMRKTNGNLDVVILNILEESATTLDWIVIGQILSEKWLDFMIFGISTSDGKLIKKSLTLGSSFLFIMNFLQNNN